MAVYGTRAVYGPGRANSKRGLIARNVPKGKAWGWHRKFDPNFNPQAPGVPKGISRLGDPSDATRSFGPSHPSDASRQAFIPREQGLNDPQVRYALMQRLAKRRRSGNTFRAQGLR